jgi:hypothetical protein
MSATGWQAASATSISPSVVGLGRPARASGTTTTAQSYVGAWELGGVVNTGWPNRPAVAFSGSLSDAALFTTELTAAQVLAEYQSSPAAGG